MRNPAGRSRRRGAIFAAAALIGGMSGGCAREDADCLARIGRKSLARAEALTGNAGDRLTAGWQALRAEGEVPLADRVAARLRWDKELAGADLTVHGTPGALELRGKVRSEEQRRHAIALAEATLGVENVTDNLEVAEATPTR